MVGPELEPAQLVLEYLDLFTREPLPGPVIDLACGEVVLIT